MIRYWTAIDQGRYRAAQNLYSDQWASKGAFARDEAQYDPGVDLESLKVKPRTPPTNGFVTLTVGVVTYDRAGTYQGVCRQWGGWVRLIREGGQWRYLPGDSYQPRPSFGLLGPLPSGDTRCRRARSG